MTTDEPERSMLNSSGLKDYFSQVLPLLRGVCSEINTFFCILKS